MKNSKKIIFLRIAACMACILALCALLAGCGGKKAESSPVTESTAQSGGENTQSSPTTDSTIPDGGENKEDSPMIEITMQDGGVIVLELDSAAAPITVENFVKLAEDGFYDGTTFHRVVEDFMIQGGDPDGTGSGGPGYTIKGEFAQNGWENPLSHTRGTVSMARGNHPDSAGSQFFITNADATSLDGGYAAFGRVTEGMEVVDAITAVEKTYDSRGELSVPLQPIVIESVRVLP